MGGSPQGTIGVVNQSDSSANSAGQCAMYLSDLTYTI